MKPQSENDSQKIFGGSISEHEIKHIFYDTVNNEYVKERDPTQPKERYLLTFRNPLDFYEES